MSKVPVRLQKDSILESIFEVRFQAAMPSAADVLQGAIYPALKNRLPRVQRTIMGSLPQQLLDQNPELRYQPRLNLRNDTLTVFLGDSSVAVGCSKPYIGWNAFRPLIMELLDLVKLAKVADGDPERVSLKYVNLLEGENPAEQFSLVHFDATLGRAGYKLNSILTATHTEIQVEGFTNIVDLAANATVRTEKGETFSGLMLTVDTVYPAPRDFWENPQPHVEKLHGVEKQVFFDILTEDTINKMGPVWN